MRRFLRYTDLILKETGYIFMAKQRDGVLDAMRGIGIVLMVVGHSGFPGSGFIYLFHMALFFMLSGYFFRLGEGVAGLRHFCVRRLLTLWLPFVAANTVFTLCNNLFLRLNILTSDPRILDLPGNQLTDPVTLKDIVGRTLHWCVFDGGTQLGGALWFVQALFQISLLYALVEFLLRRLAPGRDTLLPQGLVAGALLMVGWTCSRTGWNVWGLGIAASGYSLYYLGALVHRIGQPARKPAGRVLIAAGAFVVLLVLLPLGSVGLAANQYPHWLFLLIASAAGWVLVYECAHLAVLLPRLGQALSALGRATMPIVILHFLSFKLVTWLGLQITGGEPYLLAAFPTLFTGGAWWLAYTAAGLALPLLVYQPYRAVKQSILCRMRKS
ncbi:acyltransferase [Subdoligranulum variabile DSM 15176]|uniref:Acyltransferase n=2 Tax=Subdoligranulum variabile TaxID=214851 RepID=D1PIH6_9FIRM|nr:acyltransferase [Subdoligranulum variabile DSM 15176]